LFPVLALAKRHKTSLREAIQEVRTTDDYDS